MLHIFFIQLITIQKKTVSHSSFLSLLRREVVVGIIRYHAAGMYQQYIQFPILKNLLSFDALLL